MSKKPKDTDYLHISARLRAMEGRLLTWERRERMLDARSNEDAVKVLAECGWEGLESMDAQSLEAALTKNRDEAFEELRKLAPDPILVDVFRVKYDYHNAKALIKCAASGRDPASMLSPAGRYPADTLREALEADEAPAAVSKTLWDAAGEARDTLAATGDPQRSDFLLDRAYFGELTEMAKASGSRFLQEYVALRIDVNNLRAAVRAIRQKKGADFLNRVLVSGGTVSPGRISAAAVSGGSLADLFPEALREAAAMGDEITDHGSQTAFERACDNVLGAYLKKSRMVPFGESVLISYLGALENDLTAVRIILGGRLAGVPTESIRERMREAYV